MTAYEDLLARLLPARRFGVVLGLERMHAMLDRLGHPERRLGRTIHVGGTNGKGSAVAFAAHLLHVHGARVATYTSPHLSSLRERICFDGRPIDEDAIVAAADRVRAAGGDELTFFEQLTAIACVAIAEHGVDFTILEVGLGGRLDATNAIDADVAVVTGVAIDHTAILGDSLDAIAREKAGIFKPGRHAVIGASGEPAARAMLVDAARQAGSITHVVGDPELAIVASRAPTLAPFQQANAAAAVAALAALGFDEAVVDGIATAPTPPGRFEIIPLGDEIAAILDGAHNPHAARAFAAELRRRDHVPVAIVAASADKDVPGIAAALAPVVRHVIATRYQQDRAMPPGELAAVFRQLGVSTETAPDLAAALARAKDPGAAFRTMIVPQPPIAITGSLFLVGEARTLLLGVPTDPFTVTDPTASQMPGTPK